ncbi:MAG: hypothetical protein KDI32_02735, partial [Pseudomonadales bacterium]|nr:hypothetical protein [Pseudomonadales bacterium]
MNENRPPRDLFVQLTRPEVLGEVVGIVIAVLIALMGAHFLRRWYEKHPPSPDHPRWQLLLIETTVRLAPFFFAAVLLLGVRAALGILDLHTAVIDVALQLVTALLLVSLGVYLLRLSLGPKSWVRTWENQITAVVWLMMSFHLLGWFDAMERYLDAFDLLPGKATFTLWALLKGIVVVTGFMIITSLVARAIERRVMRLDGVAMSTRIG